MVIKYSMHEIEAMLEKCIAMGYDPKLEVSFISRYDYYLIRSSKEAEKKFTLQRAGKEEDRSMVFSYDTFEELAKDGSLDELRFDLEWNDIDYMSCYEFDKCSLWNDICREMYFCGEDYDDIRVINAKYEGINTLKDLFMILVKCYRREMAHPSCQDDWTESDPTLGQSQITAMLVNELFGGEIYETDIDGRAHYFNKIDGRYVDLARDHYDELFAAVPYENGKTTEEKALVSEEVADRYEMLKKKIADYIEMVS